MVAIHVVTPTCVCGVGGAVTVENGAPVVRHSPRERAMRHSFGENDHCTDKRSDRPQGDASTRVRSTEERLGLLTISSLGFLLFYQVAMRFEVVQPRRTTHVRLMRARHETLRQTIAPSHHTMPYDELAGTQTTESDHSTVMCAARTRPPAPTG